METIKCYSPYYPEQEYLSRMKLSNVTVDKGHEREKMMLIIAEHGCTVSPWQSILVERQGRAMNDLIRLLDKVIGRGFPELLGEDIRIEYIPLKHSLLAYGNLSHEGFYIEVDTQLNVAPVDVMTGGIAHECAHIVFEKHKKGSLMSFDMFAYRVSSRYRAMDERNTDLEVILRGFGHELLQFLRHSVQLGLDHYREDGLSIREIENILSVKNTNQDK
jgi:hypothetical protein